MELIKYYNQRKKYIKTLDRGNPYAKDLWYNIVVGLIINLRTQKLYLQLDTKNNLQLTAGGHVQYNEKINEAIIREMLEETGINASCCELLRTFTYKYYPKKQFHKYFIYSADITLDSFHINDKEEIKNFIEIQLSDLLNQSDCFAIDTEGTEVDLKYEQLLKAFNSEYVLNQICSIIKSLTYFKKKRL